MYRFDLVIARLPRSGFETVIQLGSTDTQFFRAAALDVNHEVIGSTAIWDLSKGNSSEATGPIVADHNNSAKLGLETRPPLKSTAVTSFEGWRLVFLFLTLVGLTCSLYYLSFVGPRHRCACLCRVFANITRP